MFLKLQLYIKFWIRIPLGKIPRRIFFYKNQFASIFNRNLLKDINEKRFPRELFLVEIFYGNLFEPILVETIKDNSLKKVSI
jgi:hypothetical protein